MPAGVAALVAIAAALVVVGIGVAACIGIMAVVAGDWQDVARRFPASQRPNGRIYRGQSGRFEGARYNGILMVVPSPYGLYVEVERPFAFRHPALLLPWFA